MKLGGRWEAIQSVGVGVPKRGVRHTGNIASAPFAREKPPPPPFGQSGGVEACFCPLPVRRPPIGR